MVTKAGGKGTGSWEAGNRRRKETNLAKTKADPATRMDGIVVKGRSSGAHVELPWIVAPIQSESREIGAAGEIGRKSDE
jgi:hypothetical protein